MTEIQVIATPGGFGFIRSDAARKSVLLPKTADVPDSRSIARRAVDAVLGKRASSSR
ncbi:hypothetical protein [Glaciibacter flavus]|uniref:hypothetical protein n=1 Tax=Orlajensenia flava TaxID=2565934 RepID=UPI003B0077DE